MIILEDKVQAFLTAAGKRELVVFRSTERSC
jgi:hypothetical protein